MARIGRAFPARPITNGLSIQLLPPEVTQPYYRRLGGVPGMRIAGSFAGRSWCIAGIAMVVALWL